MKITYVIPVKTVSEANRHEHWRGRQRRAKGQRNGAHATSYNAQIYSAVHDAGCCATITLTRLTKHKPRMDGSANLGTSMKAVQDGIADALGIDDGDPRLTWRYEQEKADEIGVRVEIEVEPEAT